MIIRNNVPIYSICWLNHAEGGMVGTLYEPESKKELAELCKKMYLENKPFDIIGHTSNLYFLPNYNVDIMVSTRKVVCYDVFSDCIVADCGVPVRMLSREMVNAGICGFEGLIDLPGTVAASVYGNASCYKCSINDILISLEYLRPDGEIVILNRSDLKLAKRSSAFKRGEIRGVILSCKLSKRLGDKKIIREQAEMNHNKRKSTQPPAVDNLGSIYTSADYSLYSYLPRVVAKSCSLLFRFLKGDREKDVYWKVLLSLLGKRELFPYIHGWNRYIWKDSKSHMLFWEYHKLHKKMFKSSDFEIEIKGSVAP